MDERRCLVRDYHAGYATLSELCRRYGVSRKTGYKWIRRFEEEGVKGLQDRPRRRRSCSHAVPEPVVEELVKIRKRHPTWGARKLLKVLQRRRPDWHLPCASTAHEVIKRAGLVPRRRKRPKRPHPGRPMTPMDRPNVVWTADFKGQFKTLDGIYVFPLTIQDGYSRYLLEVQGLDSTKTEPAKAVFRRAFQTYGLPERIRTDNGVPFAANSLARLSRLSVWFLRLGITPELIEPGRPQQNGRHERMHRTLKRETARPPKRSKRAQQRRFSAFRVEFNTERPHEAIGMRTPDQLYAPSPRVYPRRLPLVDYPAHYEVRKVSGNGGIRWANKWVNVSIVLGGEFIGLEEIDDGLWHVFFGPHLIGYMIDDLGSIQDRAGFLSRRNQRQQQLLPMSPD